MIVITVSDIVWAIVIGLLVLLRCILPEKDKDKDKDGDTVKLRKGVKKFRAENYVIYDVNYLLENLAREIFLLYQTGKDFSKSAFNFDNIRRMFVDYAPCEKCTNPYTWGHICCKCGACGRKFDDKGCLIDNE